MSIRTSVEEETHVATIRIDRPAKRNALSPPMLEDLREAFTSLPERESVRVVVVEGTDGIFSAGADISEFQNRVEDPRAEKEFVEQIHATYATVEDCEVPVVAKIDGPAVGAGCEIALSADLRVASKDASLSLGEIDIGLVPPFERISAYLGRATVRELCYTGRALEATKPAAEKVFNRIVESAELDEATESLVGELTEKSPFALRATKRAFRHAESSSKDESIAYRKQLEYECFDHPDFAESIAAFREGREPDYR